MLEIQRATAKQLAYKIKSTSSNRPRFALFLGAGASRQSGIITASEMIRYFKEEIFQQEYPNLDLKGKEELEKWLSEQDWYKHTSSEYSKLFERYEPKEMGRQRYIESIIEGKSPSYGYVVLANLMWSNKINTILTTNFDDLIYSACTMYADIRPIVFAYGVLASEMRVAIPRPKILKLHGDYLYSELKNTEREVAAQDPNMARQLYQVLNEYGLIVVGYAGNDKSVMEILDQISEKNDLYWCVHKGEQPNAIVQNLLSTKKGFLVEIEGFDELMKEILNTLGLDIQITLGSMQSRQEQIIENLKSVATPETLPDILRGVADALVEQAAQHLPARRKELAQYFFAQGLEALTLGKTISAETEFRKAIELDPHDANAHNNLGIILAENAAHYAEAEAEYHQAIELNPDFSDPYYNLGVLFHKQQRLSEAEDAFHYAINLAPGFASAFNRLGILLSQDTARAIEAEAAYHKAIELDPINATIYYNLGNLLAKDTARAVEAEVAYRKAIELDPKFAAAYYNLGVQLRNVNRSSESEAAFNKAIELDPKLHP